MPRLIDAYLSEFDRHLAFDRRLARKVRNEVESHLFETLEHDTSEAEAVARFGDPQTLSKAFAEAALASRVRMTAAMLAILAVTTFALMRLRSLWFDLDASQLALQAPLATVDRAGFALGMVLGGFAYWSIRRTQQNMDHAVLASHGAMLCFAISIAASLMRAISVAGPDNVIWLTGGLEAIGLVVMCWHLRLTFRHAGVVHAARRTA